MIIWKRKKNSQKPPQSKQKENQFLSKKKKNHRHVHFENTMQGLARSHDHLLGGLDVFPTNLNYV